MWYWSVVGSVGIVSGLWVLEPCRSWKLIGGVWVLDRLGNCRHV